MSAQGGPFKKKCSLTADRIQQLEELGFAWTTERTKQQNEDWGTKRVNIFAQNTEKISCLNLDKS